jgi:GNAT superfamily N-acetyltransferase
MRAATAVDLAIRALTPDDAPRLTRLLAVLGTESRDELLARPRRHDLIVLGAEHYGDLIAYAAGDVRPSLGVDGATGWVDAFGIALPYRGEGVARALVVELIGRLRHRGAARVCAALPLHDRTIGPFLRRLGFREAALSCLVRDL